jgi:GNAT superfamily N-acetyltransferase
MPPDYFDRFCFDSWVFYPTSKLLNLYTEKWLGKDGHLRWYGRDESDRVRYGFEVRDREAAERLGWSFAVERDGAVEVEELYVRPEYRRRGHGRWLAERLGELARAKKLPLRLWVPFSDARRESGATFPALQAVVRRMGLQFARADVPWAAYLATNVRPGSETPVEPEFFPARPRSTRKDLLAAVLALGLGGAPPDSAASPTAATSAVADVPAIGTPEWGRMNQERAALIRKKVRGELSDDELVRYEYLQSRSLASIEVAFPRGVDEPA